MYATKQQLPIGPPRSRAIVTAIFGGGVALLAIGLGVELSDVKPAAQGFVAVICAGLGFMLVTGSVRDWRLTRKNGYLTLTSTRRLRVVPATRKRVEGFVSVCDPVTMEAFQWNEDDVHKLRLQVESGRTPLRLVIDRPAGRVIGCVIPAISGTTLTLTGWIGVEHRRQGYGSELLELVCADAFRAKCRSVLVGVPASDRVLASFMEQHKFVATGSNKLLSLHDTQIDIVLYRRISPEVNVSAAAVDPQPEVPESHG
jgi:hypothetical protein